MSACKTRGGGDVEVVVAPGVVALESAVDLVGSAKGCKSSLQNTFVRFIF